MRGAQHGIKFLAGQITGIDKVHRLQPAQRIFIGGKPVTLEDGRTPPGKPQPAQIIQNTGHEPVLAPRMVNIIDPQDIAAADMACHHCRKGMSKMHFACGAWGKSRNRLSGHDGGDPGRGENEPSVCGAQSSG